MTQAVPPPGADAEPRATAAAAAPRTFGQWLRDMPRWKQVTIGCAVLVAVTSGVWAIATGDAPPTTGGGQSVLSADLIEGGRGSGQAAAAVADEPTAKGVFRLGFSFIAGFCIGSFVRATVKVAAIAFGFWLLMTMLLSYYDLVTVDWKAIQSVWERFGANVADEWGDFSRFMLGSLPATGLATTGLVIGLKRH